MKRSLLLVLSLVSFVGGGVRATRSLHDEVPRNLIYIFLQLLLTLLLPTFPTLTSSSIVAVLIAKAGHVWVS